MAQRGEVFRKEAKRRIIEYLIGREGASPSELAEAVGVSRVTLSILLDELVDKACSICTTRRSTRWAAFWISTRS